MLQNKLSHKDLHILAVAILLLPHNTSNWVSVSEQAMLLQKMDIHTSVQEPHEAETSIKACEQQHLVNADLCGLAQHSQPYCLTARVFQKPLHHPQCGCSPSQETDLLIVPSQIVPHRVLQTKAVNQVPCGFGSRACWLSNIGTPSGQVYHLSTTGIVERSQRSTLSGLKQRQAQVRKHCGHSCFAGAPSTEDFAYKSQMHELCSTKCFQ